MIRGFSLSHAKRMPLRACAVAITCCGLAIGCGTGPKKLGAEVSGTVLIDGDLVESGTVTFHPVEEGPPAVGRIHTDGSYSVRVGQGDLSDPDGGTLAPGEYRVTVVVTGQPGKPLVEGGPPAAGPRLMAAKYASADATDLVFDVKPGANVFVLDLDRAAPEDAGDDDSAEAEDEAEGGGADEPSTEKTESSEKPEADQGAADKEDAQ